MHIDSTYIKYYYRAMSRESEARLEVIRNHKLIMISPTTNLYTSAAEVLNLAVAQSSEKINIYVGSSLASPISIGLEPEITKFFPDGIVSGTNWRNQDMNRLLKGERETCSGWIKAIIQGSTLSVEYEFARDAAADYIRQLKAAELANKI